MNKRHLMIMVAVIISIFSPTSKTTELVITKSNINDIWQKVNFNDAEIRSTVNGITSTISFLKVFNVPSLVIKGNPKVIPTLGILSSGVCYKGQESKVLELLYGLVVNTIINEDLYLNYVTSQIVQGRIGFEVNYSYASGKSNKKFTLNPCSY